MASVVRAYKGHYTVEFSFDDKTYYVVNDFKENGERDIRIYTEQEYLLEENNPETLFRLWDTAEESGISGELPAGMCFELESAMEMGKRAAQ
jgi:hypothetical protein